MLPKLPVSKSAFLLAVRIVIFVVALGYTFYGLTYDIDTQVYFGQHFTGPGVVETGLIVGVIVVLLGIAENRYREVQWKKTLFTYLSIVILSVGLLACSLLRTPGDDRFTLGGALYSFAVLTIVMPYAIYSMFAKKE